MAVQDFEQQKVEKMTRAEFESELAQRGIESTPIADGEWEFTFHDSLSLEYLIFEMTIVGELDHQHVKNIVRSVKRRLSAVWELPW